MALAAAAALALGGCRSAGREVVVYLSIDQPFTEPILRDYERQSGIKVRAVFDTEETKSTGVVNRIIAEAKNPQADVFWSGDPVRALVLVEKGLVERIDTGPGSARYEARHASGEHHHHLVCDDCGKVEAFADEKLERAIHEVQKRAGARAHHILLRGACADCRPA
jgi:hypothetical protein